MLDVITVYVHIIHSFVDIYSDRVSSQLQTYSVYKNVAQYSPLEWKCMRLPVFCSTWIFLGQQTDLRIANYCAWIPFTVIFANQMIANQPVLFKTYLIVNK